MTNLEIAQKCLDSEYKYVEIGDFRARKYKDRIGLVICITNKKAIPDSFGFLPDHARFRLIRGKLIEQ